MDAPLKARVTPTHVVVRAASETTHAVPPRVQPGDRVIGVVATALWAIDGVYEVVTGLRRRDSLHLRPTTPTVDPRGVSLTAVEARIRRVVPRAATTLDPVLADLAITAIGLETVSPTPWYRVDHSCERHSLTENDMTVARAWGCTTCGRDPHTEYAPRFAAHALGLRIDSRIDLDITIAVCPSCHEILHQPLAPTARELMYGLRPGCPRCGSRHADVVTVDHADLPLPIGVAAFTGSIEGTPPDFRCGACRHEW